LTQDFFVTPDQGCVAAVATADGRVHYLSPSSLSHRELRKILEVGAYCGDEGEFSGSDDIPDARWYPGRRPNWPNIAAFAVWLLSVATLLAAAVRSRRPLPVPSTPLDAPPSAN
jgi:hypothetical protein